MAAGRYRSPITVLSGHYSKEFKKLRKESEKVYGEVPRLKLVAPDYLSERAKDKFDGIVNDAFWLDQLSVDILAAYCMAWDRYDQLAMQLKEEPDSLKDDKGKWYPNPNRKALLDYQDTMLQCSARLGLGNIDRLKLVAPTKKKEDNKFSKFMNSEGAG